MNFLTFGLLSPFNFSTRGNFMKKGTWFDVASVLSLLLSLRLRFAGSHNLDICHQSHDLPVASSPSVKERKILIFIFSRLWLENVKFFGFLFRGWIKVDGQPAVTRHSKHAEWLGQRKGKKGSFQFLQSFFWLAVPKGPMTYAFIYGEISPSTPPPPFFVAPFPVSRPHFYLGQS